MNEQQLNAIIHSTVETAEKWQNRANRLIVAEEKRIQQQMMQLLTHPKDKVTLTRLIDQCFRSKNYHRISDQVHAIFKSRGVPQFFSWKDKILLHLFLKLGRHIPALSIPKMIEKMRKDTNHVIIDGEPETLLKHLDMRRSNNIRMNLNHLGEAVLGEKEAATRLKTYLEDMRNPDIEVISVKVSTLYSQISSFELNHSVNILKSRLSVLYREACTNYFVRPDGSKAPKLVNLDMEEYRDLEITYSTFIQTLDLPEFKNYRAGIALQAYLPDSYRMQQELTKWAKKRVANGGSPIMLRIVKGANMEMEMLQSSLFNWPLAPYDNKLEVDANFKRMITYGIIPENIHAVNLGIASHNLFELAFAYQMAIFHKVQNFLHFEMLEGMANHVQRALAESTQQMLLYAPVANQDEFINAIGYLVRRMDENTGKENFLSYAPGLQVGSNAWQFLKNQFISSCQFQDKTGINSHRIQDRTQETFPPSMGTYYDGEFNNEPDTDWCLPKNREWANGIKAKWQKQSSSPAIEIPIVIAGENKLSNYHVMTCIDPSQLPQKNNVATFHKGNIENIDQAVSVAKNDPDGWRKLSIDQRHQILSQVAINLRQKRGDLIGAAAANTGKIFTEADVEVSEAIDFAEYYPLSVRQFAHIQTVKFQGKGVGVVVSPWNFPIAIPCGGLIASLSTGNTVIFKPSSDAVLVAWELCQCFWQAGITKNVLQFLPCEGTNEGMHLVTHSDVDFVILTGGTDTGMAMLNKHPRMLLSAETGGKNATIVTAMADKDQAIKNVIYSAFGNSGQKCSATSLLILEKEVYQDQNFKRQLVDAAQSFTVGSAWDFSSKMGPLIHSPTNALKLAFTSLAPKESWALKPEMINQNPYMWSPGIKYGVQPESHTHMTEFFGPLLGVMEAHNLDHAIELVNQTGYGLTSGLESLDEREQSKWKNTVQAGNLYINRGTTGAITLRQPFGGMGKSAIGPALKAGGPNYITQFMDFKDTAPPISGSIQKENSILRLILAWRRKILGGQLSQYKEDLLKTIRAIKSYLYHWENEFSVEKDYFNLRGQDNIHRYRPIGTIAIRLHKDDSLFETLARIAAAQITGNVPVLSISKDLNNMVTKFFEKTDGQNFLGSTPVRRQSDQSLIAALEVYDRIRYAQPDRAPLNILQAGAKRGYYIARLPILMEGRLELLHYVHNQSICNNYHRYGNLGDRTEL